MSAALQLEWQKRHDAIVATITRPRPEAMAAARWWVGRARAKGRPNTGDDRQEGVLMGFRALMGQTIRYPARIYDTLEAELAAGIEAEIIYHEGFYTSRDAEQDPSIAWRWHTILSVDYSPDYTLAAAAERAGFDEITTSGYLYPLKSTMWIDRGKVSVKGGYGAHPAVVWASAEGANYWASQAMADCRDALHQLAAGLGAANMLRLANDLLAEGDRLERRRPKALDAEQLQPQPPPDRDPNAYTAGLGAVLDLALTWSGDSPAVRFGDAPPPPPIQPAGRCIVPNAEKAWSDRLEQRRAEQRELDEHIRKVQARKVRSLRAVFTDEPCDAPPDAPPVGTTAEPAPLTRIDDDGCC